MDRQTDFWTFCPGSHDWRAQKVNTVTQRQTPRLSLHSQSVYQGPCEIQKLVKHFLLSDDQSQLLLTFIPSLLFYDVWLLRKFDFDISCFYCEAAFSFCFEKYFMNKSLLTLRSHPNLALLFPHTSQSPPIHSQCSQSSHHERPAPEDPSEALVVGSGEQWQVSWSTVAQSGPPTLPDPLETRHTPHTNVRWGKHHLQGQMNP